MQRNDMKTSATIVTLQLSISGTPEERVKWIKEKIEEISRGTRKPDFVLLPELWYCGFFDFDHYKSLAEDLGGRTAALARDISEKLNCYTISGSFVEKKGNNYFNTTLLINPDGELCGTYSKIHLFGYQSAENEILTRGSKIFVTDTTFGKIGFSTCYDLRFPELFRAMTDQGTEAFFIVSAWPEARLAHWQLFNQVRAVENQCFLVSCNCVGAQNGTKLAGHSMTVAPDGQVLMEANDSQGVFWSTIDFQQVKKARDTFPALHDRSSMFRSKE